MNTVDPLLNLAEHARRDGLVILAGAGVSVPPPSSLPGWKDFNDAVLEALASRAEQVTAGALPGIETTRGLRTLRDQTGALPIDFQAQLMEEECGPDYFRVLQVLDTESPNACHLAIAALAGTAALKAIVTTNFDRLIERALDARHVTYRVFRSPADFDALGDAITAGNTLPVIKVHGSVESPDSMVDTLRQRLLGRPEVLVRALEALFARHALLIAGFSGADLGYDEEYLGLRAGARRSPCVVALTHAGKDPLPAMAALIADCPNATPVPGLLPTSLIDASTPLGATVPALLTVNTDAIRAERLQKLAAGVNAWVETQGDLSATNILGAVIEGVSTRAAFVLFREASPRVLQSPDRTKDGYWRFQVNFGRCLLERGYLGQDLPLAETIEEITSGRLDEADLDDALRILTRAAWRGSRLDAFALLARAHAYRGEYPIAIELVKRFRQAAIEARNQLAIFEAFLSGATVHALVGNWSAGLEWLEGVHPKLRRFGDEPRRARLCAHLGRFLAWAERYDEAERLLGEGVTIATRLKLGLVHAELHAAWGYLELDRHRPDEAVRHLQAASLTFARAELTSLLLPVLLDLSEAALRAHQSELSAGSLEAVADELDRYPGLAGHYHHRLGIIMSLSGRFDDARRFLAAAREEGQAMGNAWVTRSAEDIEQSIRNR